MKIAVPFLLVLICLVALSPAADEPKPVPAPTDDAPPKIEMNDLERKFEKTMSGATLVGRFSTHGKEDVLPKEDRYLISKVTKIGPDLWLFTARVGDRKVPIPIPLPVKWAGDTPVISMTKLTIPTMGTYTARVMIYEGHYAGTWDAGDHGGHLWGRVERAPKADGGPAPADKPKG